MSREGRSQPIQPFATHGFLGNVPANGVLPGRVLVVDTPATDDRRRKTPPLQPVVISGVLALPPPTVTPPPPLAVEPTRPRRLPEQPVALNGLYTVTTAPSVVPPKPVIVPLGERARVTPPPQSASGFDLVTPPAANVVEPKDRRRQTPDPFTLSGLLAVQPFVQVPPPVVTEPEDKRRRYPPPDPAAVNAALLAIQVVPQVDTPPGPFVVPIEQRRRLFETLAVAEHGFVDPGPAAVGTTPPPLTNLDREDQRKRYLPLDPLILSGVLIPFVPPPPVVVQAGTDWAASIASFY